MVSVSESNRTVQSSVQQGTGCINDYANEDVAVMLKT